MRGKLWADRVRGGGRSRELSGRCIHHCWTIVVLNTEVDISENCRSCRFNAQSCREFRPLPPTSPADPFCQENSETFRHNEGTRGR